jgi:hypothetical protein
LEEQMMKRIVSVAVVLLVLAGQMAHAQQGIGKTYGSREPQTCDAKKAPSTGAPSGDEAKYYVTCHAEHISSGDLFLVSDVKVEVSKGRPFNARTDSMAGIDPVQPVFDIRGSFTGYLCEPLGKMIGAKMYGPAAGKNCRAHDEPNATGICYKDTFGDWHCQMSDVAAAADYRSARQGVPPPK